MAAPGKSLVLNTRVQMTPEIVTQNLVTGIATTQGYTVQQAGGNTLILTR